MKTVITIVFLAAALLAGDALRAAPDGTRLLVEMNESILGVAETEDGFLTLKGLRTATMAHIAMHDVQSAIRDEYAAFVYTSKSPHASPIAAMAQAGYAVAISQYPDQERRFSSMLGRWLAAVSEDDARQRGIELGDAVATRILETRSGDGWDTDAEYQWHPMAAGVYAEFNDHSGTPQGFIFGTGWAKARGFVLQRADQFRAPPPPDIDSKEYTAAYREVREVGRFQSMTRTPDQTHLALWWKDFAENSHNRLARDLVISQNLDAVATARLFALVNMSIYDAYVSVFENKFFYNHWRPYTAIRWAANDGNPDTDPEETWDNTHRHTYAFPSYPSAHGTACAAAMTAFADTFGDVFEFTMHTPMVDVAGPFSGKIEMHPPTRRFERFSDAAMECALSRVYLGIHFRYDSTAGFELGQRIGENILANALTDKR